MYMTSVKTMITEAMSRVFDADYPEQDFRDVLVSLEFPAEPTQYPSIWVDFEPTGDLEVAGIGHIEYAEADDNFVPFTRWRFSGFATYTVVALNSLEHARLYDEVVRVLAMGTERAPTAEYRAYIEDNEFIAANGNFDQIRQSGWAATNGTPWGSDETIYEGTLSIGITGEFVSRGPDQALVPLSSVVVYPYAENEPDPTEGSPEPPWH